MGIAYNTSIVRDGLVLHLDAANVKSYPRSGTVWKDLQKNTDVTLVNGPTYNTAGKGALVFDGINDYARPSVIHSYLQPSALEIIFRSTSHGTGYKTLVGYRHNGGYSNPTIGSIFLNGNTLSASVITTSQVYRFATFSTPIQTNTTYHVVLNKDTITGTLQLFVNGVSGQIQTCDASTYAQWNTIGSFIGANILDIGKSSNNNAEQGWASDYFNGYLYRVCLYSRILTPSEIKQNFEAVRGRYGI